MFLFIFYVVFVDSNGLFVILYFYKLSGVLGQISVVSERIHTVLETEPGRLNLHNQPIVVQVNSPGLNGTKLKVYTHVIYIYYYAMI